MQSLMQPSPLELMQSVIRLKAWPWASMILLNLDGDTAYLVHILSTCGATRIWQASKDLLIVMAQKWSSCTTTTPGNPKEPLSKVESSISCGVLSIKTSRMLQSIWVVVPRTSTEKRTLQIKSNICHLGLYQIMALAIMTPTLCIRSPNTCRYAPCTMLLSWCCSCCLHLLLLPDKSQVIITLFAFSKDYAKSWLPWASAWWWWWSANLMLE